MPTSWSTKRHQTKPDSCGSSAAANARTAGSARPSFRPDSRFSVWRITRGTRGLVTTVEESTGSVGERSAPTSSDSVQSSEVTAWVTAATSTAVSGMAMASARAGTRHARWSISASTSSPSRKRITISATVASPWTNPEWGSKSSTPMAPLPSRKPATTNTAVSDRKLRRATPAISAPSTSSPPKTAAVSSNEVLASGITGRERDRRPVFPALLGWSLPARGPALSAGEALLAQPAGRGDLVLVLLRVVADLLEQRGQLLEARLGQERRQPGLAELAVRQVLVPVAVRAERHGGVVHVDAREAVEPEVGLEVVHHPREPVVRSDVEAAGEHVAAVEAHADPLRPAAEVDELVELLERPADRASRPGGVLEEEAARVGLAEHLLDRLTDALQGRRKRLLQRRSGMDHHAVGADRVAHPERVRERGQRLLPHLAVLRRQVDQVDGVDDHRLDRSAVHQRAELLDVGVLPGGRPPHAWGLVEDLDRVAVQLDAAPMRLHETARRRDVSAD